MKTLYKSFISVLFSVSLFSCSESLLNEKPLSSFSPENAYVTLPQFEQAIWDMHLYVRDGLLFYTDGGEVWGLFAGTDQSYDPVNTGTGPFSDYSLITPGYYWFNSYYSRFYQLVAKANAVISRSTSQWSELTVDQQNYVIASGKFFRAFAYRGLAQLYGGVPKVDSEVVSPKRDYVRASRREIYELCRDDLIFAAQYLPKPAAQRGALSAAIANHLLSEIYICLSDWDNAIKAASAVIDDPQYELMKIRFGTRINRDGDVFYDLSREGNINREGGNKETLWALQYQYSIPGGQNNNIAWNAGYGGGRAWICRWWTLMDPDGKAGTVAVNTMCRGASFMRPTYYASTEVFKSDWNDMRNSQYNIQRDFHYNNPASAYFGQKITNLYNESDTLMAYYPSINKVWDYPFPSDFTQAQTFRDYAMARLSETYLLRAEAYLGKGEKELAANDINEVRGRANATPCSANDVDIDYILDERTRELFTEELRHLTLCRLGKLYERTKKYNPFSGKNIKPHNNLWAIPTQVIDANTDAVIEQNEGYSK